MKNVESWQLYDYMFTNQESVTVQVLIVVFRLN